MSKKRNEIKVKTHGYKKKKVKIPRKKLRKVGPSCRKHSPEEEWVSRHTQRRRTGRMIRKMKRLAQNPQQM
ncbi:hypothetical protein A3860_36010 [Niastella vici]|uniref:Uncharacterized protein n=1 Tax=Niastella vici TaxID=1703345 RepID=A0A1V9FNH8_9BACT|nr:hypothetical protein [Niastella vici]OQP59919.1 hypothetical protein A3860_36010 [Niastella vici]